MKGNSLCLQQLDKRRRQQMLAGMLLHVVAAALRVDQPGHFSAGRQHLRDSVPYFTFVVLKDILNSNLERHSRFGFCREPSAIKRLSSTRWIKRSAVQLHSP